MGLVNEAVMALGWAPPAWVEHCWSVSLFGGICALVTVRQADVDLYSTHQWYPLPKNWPSQLTTAVCHPGHLED